MLVQLHHLTHRSTWFFLAQQTIHAAQGMQHVCRWFMQKTPLHGVSFAPLTAGTRGQGFGTRPAEQCVFAHSEPGLERPGERWMHCYCPSSAPEHGSSGDHVLLFLSTALHHSPYFHSIHQAVALGRSTVVYLLPYPHRTTSANLHLQ